MAEILRKINRGLHKCLLAVAQVALIVLVVIVTYTVIARFFFNTGNSWAEELPRILVALFAFLACSMGVRDHLHVGVSVIYNRFAEDGKMRKFLDFLTDFCVFIVALFMIKVGFDYCVSLAARGGKLPMTQWPVWIQYASIPVSGVIMAFDSLLFMTGVLKQNDTIFSDPDDDPVEQARAMMKENEKEAKEGNA